MNKTSKIMPAMAASAVGVALFFVAHAKDAPLLSEVEVRGDNCVMIQGVNAGLPEDVKINWPNHKAAVEQKLEAYLQKKAADKAAEDLAPGN